MKMNRILAISGSLRTASLNTALLRAVFLLAPQNVEIILYGGLGNLPLFNPDLEGADLPAAVSDLRRQVRTADGLLIASPEYAHGVSGPMKNALDWLVGGEEFVDKPVALLNASSRAIHAQASLVETISVMTAHIVTAACITVPLLGKNLDAAAIAADTEIAGLLRNAILAFVETIHHRRT